MRRSADRGSVRLGVNSMKTLWGDRFLKESSIYLFNSVSMG